jgi:hypothetical protein
MNGGVYGSWYELIDGYCFVYWLECGRLGQYDLIEIYLEWYARRLFWQCLWKKVYLVLDSFLWNGLCVGDTRCRDRWFLLRRFRPRLHRSFWRLVSGLALGLPISKAVFVSRRVCGSFDCQKGLCPLGLVFLTLLVIFSFQYGDPFSLELLLGFVFLLLSLFSWSIGSLFCLWIHLYLKSFLCFLFLFKSIFLLRLEN